MSSVLDRRTLNRTTLHRQHLLERAEMDPPAMLENLVGMQAQNPLDPYFGMWARVEKFDQNQLGSLVRDAGAVRGQLMRGTIHMVTSRDFIALRPVFGALCARILGSTQFGKDTSDLDRRALLARGRRLLSEKPRTRVELGALLEIEFPGFPAPSLAQAVTYLLPVIQIPPRGVWGETGPATWALLDPGEPSPGDIEATRKSLVLRYLRAFGPASIKDIRAWSGLTGLAATVDHLRERLRTYQDRSGNELLDVADGVIIDGNTPAPARLLPEYDNVLLGHADRSRFFDEAGPVPPGWAGNVLVDGVYAGSWKLDRGALSLSLQTEVTSRQRREVTEEIGLLQAAIMD